MSDEQKHKAVLRTMAWKRDNPEKRRAAGRRRYAKHRERLRAYKRAWAAKHRDPAKPKKSWLREEAKRVGLEVKYQCLWNWTQRGITVQQIKDLLVAQNWRCGICREEFVESPRLDHDHVTGRVRGFLCGKCNSGIGLLRDSVLLLESAVEYMKAHA